MLPRRVVKLLGWKPSLLHYTEKDLSWPVELALDKASPTLEGLHQKLSQVRQRFRTWKVEKDRTVQIANEKTIIELTLFNDTPCPK